MKQNQKHYVCVASNGCMIGIDSASGGYPWMAGEYGLSGVEFWTDPGKAKKYADSFENSSMKEYRGMTVREFHFQYSDPIV